MRDMTIIENKKIVNKDNGEIRQVVSINESERQIFWVPAGEPDAEPKIMTAATYDRRWSIYEEPAAETPAEEATPTAEPEEPTTEDAAAETSAKENGEAAHTDPMKMGETITALEGIFDKLNEIYFKSSLPRPVITVQTTPKAYGHCTTKKVWKSEEEAMYEINLGAEFINRPKENTCATLLHEMVHLYCAENEIADTCQKGRYHNKNFKNECEARDLEVSYDRANGYAHTSPTETFKDKLREAGIDLAIRFARIAVKTKAKAEREKAHKYVCPVCGQTVRTTGELSLICGVCNVPMARED